MSAFSLRAARVELGTVTFAGSLVENLDAYLAAYPSHDGVPVSGDMLAVVDLAPHLAEIRAARGMNAARKRADE